MWCSSQYRPCTVWVPLVGTASWTQQTPPPQNTEYPLIEGEESCTAQQIHLLSIYVQWDIEKAGTSCRLKVNVFFVIPENL